VHWRLLVLLSSAPALIMGICAWFLLYESPMFLLRCGKEQKSVKNAEVLQSIMELKCINESGCLKR